MDFACLCSLSVYEIYGVKTYLFMVKSKVAPKTLIIPKMEWCGALMLTRLLKYILPKITFDIAGLCRWTVPAVD